LVRASVKNGVLHLELVGWDQLLRFRAASIFPSLASRALQRVLPACPNSAGRTYALAGLVCQAPSRWGDSGWALPVAGCSWTSGDPSKEVLVVEVDDVARVLKMIEKPRESP
jgi:hypothetical protein